MYEEPTNQGMSSASSVRLESNPLFHELLRKGFTRDQIYVMVQRRCDEKLQSRQHHAHHTAHHTAHHAAHASNAYFQPAAQPTTQAAYVPTPISPPMPQMDMRRSNTERSFALESHARRESHGHHMTTLATPAQFQEAPQKSNMEDTLQDAFRERQRMGGAMPAQPTPGSSASSRVAPSSLVEAPPTALQTPAQFHDSERQHKAQFERGEAERRKKYEQQAHDRRSKYKEELRRMQANLTEAYALLKVSSECDQRTLSRNYRRAALQYHPDRQQNRPASEKRRAAQMFESITKAYMLILEKLKEEECNQPFQNLKQQSQAEIKQQQQQQHPQQQKRSEKFDLERFNKIYSENRLAEPTDEGYGDWLTRADDDTSGEYSVGGDASVFSDKFNLNVFNAAFDQHKDNDPNVQSQLIVREAEPAAMSGYGQHAGQLGEGAVEDYSGEVNQLSYTDLKHAHSSRLIHANRVSLSGNPKSVDDLESQRERMSFQLSPADAEKQARLQAQKDEQERIRRDNVFHRDQMISDHHTRVNRLMLQKQ